MMTAAKDGGRMFVSGTPNQYLPTDYFKVKVGSRQRVSQPSAVLFGFSIPSLDRTTATQETALAENRWAQMKFIGTVVENALQSVIGLVEAGAETPWEDAAQFIAALLEPDVVEETAGNFASPSMIVYARMTFDVSVPGELAVGSLTSGM